MEAGSNVPSSAREIDQHPARIDHVDCEALGLKPACDDIQVLLRHSESLAELLWGQPLVEVSGFGILLVLEELLECPLLFGRATQLKEHMSHRKVVVHPSAIILWSRFGASVSPKRKQLPFIDALGDEGT